MAAEPFVESKLVGFFDPAFVAQGRIAMRIGDGADGMLAPEATPPSRIHDARHMQVTAQE